jgi:hypothetical protein
VLQGVSLRGVPRVLAVVAAALGWSLPIPHWTTGRLWLLRLGHAQLTAALDQAEDWAWLIDHSVQIGQEKCLVILGIRLKDLPPRGVCLQQSDMRLIALVPRPSWTKHAVDTQLEAASQRTGVPRVIVDDHGSDLAAGVRLFQGRHRRTVALYDAKHKAACLLKKRLKPNARWQQFNAQLRQTRGALQQTELACLVPPRGRTKARFMNLAATLQWAHKVLAVLREPPRVLEQQLRPERLQEKLGWLTAYAAEVAEWGEWQRVVNVTVALVNRQGVYRGAARELRQELRAHRQHGSSRALAKELVSFVAKQARRTRPGERLPGSTEVLESCFGRFKHLEKQQARGGFTSLVLGFGALLATTTTKVIREAMNRSRTKEVLQWCREHLGTTWFSQRKLAFAASATKHG